MDAKLILIRLPAPTPAYTHIHPYASQILSAFGVQNVKRIHFQFLYTKERKTNLEYENDIVSRKADAIVCPTAMPNAIGIDLHRRSGFFLILPRHGGKQWQLVLLF